MEAKAITRYARYSPKKVAQILKLIRKKRVDEVFAILKFLNKGCVDLVEKTLKSALANAGGLREPFRFYIKECWVNKGPYLKRIRPRAFGRANIYTRKMCHLTIIVSDEKPKE